MGLILLISLLGMIFGGIILFVVSKIYKEYDFNKREYIMGALLNGLFLGVIFNKFGFIEYAWLLMALSIILTALFLIDFKYQDLPDGLNLVIFLLSIIFIVVWRLHSPIPYIITAISLFIGFLLLALLTGALGGGDIKFVGAIGLFFHYHQIPQLLMYSFFTASLFAVGLMVVKKSKKGDRFAFGPFLIIGVIGTLII
ncbi:prepilin peptidase [Bacillus sp. NPDC094106]|uniref:prepilin peptidase n=1 Tax=Bacillus sp. NPDC094106 TaxID=3363949 RepID=UPI00381ED021